MIKWLDALLEDGAHLHQGAIWHFGLLDQESQLVGQQDLSIKCPRVDLSVLFCEGEQAETFLQNMITCDLQQLQPDTSMLGAFCNQKGRVVTSTQIVKREGNFYLVLPKSMVALFLDFIKPYAALSRVVFSETEQFGLFNMVFSENNLNTLETIKANLKTSNTSVLTLPGSVNIRTLCLTDIDDALTVFQDIPLEPVGLNAINQLDIKAHYPTITPPISGEFLPHDINLPALNAVSFNKGCYLGQEVIAKMEHHGKLKRSLTEVMLSEKTEPNTPLTPLEEDETVGTTLIGSEIANDMVLTQAVVKESYKDMPLKPRT